MPCKSFYIDIIFSWQKFPQRDNTSTKMHLNSIEIKYIELFWNVMRYQLGLIKIYTSSNFWSTSFLGPTERGDCGSRNDSWIDSRNHSSSWASRSYLAEGQQANWPECTRNNGLLPEWPVQAQDRFLLAGRCGTIFSYCEESSRISHFLGKDHY